ncbi:hypothetical protein GCM10023328_19330 [Modestobacter marinus]|uniref:Uncharacterized protein n=1 Tax=Modestobacter marinus TaxID=477641 RepID=A0ABQ2G359_9ACTN|nr:hypothetical protein GCM10011589_31280 [Modestobacter marinus]
MERRRSGVVGWVHDPATLSRDTDSSGSPRVAGDGRAWPGTVGCGTIPVVLTHREFPYGHRVPVSVLAG